MAVEKIVADVTKRMGIDLRVLWVGVEVGETILLKPTELLPQFVASKTGKLLYDEQSKLWWSGPSDIAEMFMAEINRED